MAIMVDTSSATSHDQPPPPHPSLPHTVWPYLNKIATPMANDYTNQSITPPEEQSWKREKGE